MEYTCSLREFHEQMDKLVLITVSSHRIIFIIKKSTSLDTENIF